MLPFALLFCQNLLFGSSGFSLCHRKAGELIALFTLISHIPERDQDQGLCVQVGHHHT